MCTRELGFYLGNSLRERLQKSGLREEIYKGLELEEAGYLKMSSAVKENIVGELEDQTQRLSKFLRIPIPSFGLLFGWKEDPGESFFSDATLLATSAKNIEFPNGIIRYSPLFLKDHINFRMGAPYKPSFSLAEVNAHEALHLWEHKYDRKTILANCKAIEIGGLKGWSNTSSERFAAAFAKNWVAGNY